MPVFVSEDVDLKSISIENDFTLIPIIALITTSFTSLVFNNLIWNLYTIYHLDID